MNQATSSTIPVSNFPVVMPWQGRDVPHITIEVNQACNINCHGCYKNKFGYKKPLQQIKDEIDLAARERNLSGITILGGEPMLYPQLAEVISHIAAKGIQPLLLTNGSLITRERLEKYKKAGLSVVRMHIDKHQHGRPDTESVERESQLDGLRLKYLNLCNEAGLQAGFALTLYKDNLDELQDVKDFCLANGVPNILATLYNQKMNADNTRDTVEDGLSTDNRDIFHFLEKSKIWPAWYIPSEQDATSMRWLLYAAAYTRASDNSWRTMYFHPRHKRVLNFIPMLTRKVTGKFRFDEATSTSQTLVGVMIYSLLSLSLPTIFQAMKFMFHALRNRNATFFRMVFQQLPTRLGINQYDLCRDCPDATVRNGKIIPVCLADRLDPIHDKPTRNRKDERDTEQHIQLDLPTRTPADAPVPSI